MYGATPANIAGQLAKVDGVRVLAGVNLPMLVRAVCYRTTPLDTLVDKALAGSTKGIHEIAAGTPPPRPSALGCGECAPIPPEPKAQTQPH